MTRHAVTVANDEAKNILEEGLLHRLMVLFQKAENLGAPGVLLIQAIATIITAVAWRAMRAPEVIPLYGALILILFTLADAALLHWLRRRQISFGPWKPQTVVLLVPRTAVSVAIALMGVVAGWSVALAVQLLAQAIGTVLLWWGAAIEPRRIGLTRLDLPVDSLPAGSKPIRLLHISDIHLERWTGRENALLALVGEATPDLIVITGDYLNLSYNKDEVAKQQLARLLSQLCAPYGVYATLGSPPVDLEREIVPVLQSLPLRLLRNEWEVVEVGEGVSLVLIGLDCTHFMEPDGACLAQVASIAPNSVPRVLLYHSPELMPVASKQNVDLYLCGHTHGGQVRLPFVGPLITSSQLGRRYVMGHYKNGKTNLYVSRGVGLEGLSAPRVRFLAPPEITLITLHPPAPKSHP